MKLSSKAWIAIALGALVVVATGLVLWNRSRPVVPGSDRDAHGCLGSGGYTWCEREKSCVRPWELAAERGFPNEEDAFAQHCGRATP